MFIDPQEENILHEFDKELHRYPAFFNLLKILTPTNSKEEYVRFLEKKGEYNPQFRYDFPDQEAIAFMQDYLQKVKTTYADKEYKSPIAQLLKEKLYEYEDRLSLIQAYASQDFEQIAFYNQKLFGEISQKHISECESMLEKAKTVSVPSSKILSRKEVMEYIRKYLDGHDCKDVKIQEANIPYRFAVSYTSQDITLRVGGFASLDKITVDAIVAHEIQTHIQRYVAGKQSGWLLLKYGTRGSLVDEEGLAVYNAIQTHKKESPDYIHVSMYQKYLVAHYASTHSFAQTAKYLHAMFPDKSLYAIYNGVLRCKMGIIDTSSETPGASFDRDSIFLTGYHRIQEWTENGGDLKQLQRGKIKIDDISVLS